MAGTSSREIKNRIRSMESTRQITKAMGMVASSRLRKAQADNLRSQPYFTVLSHTIRRIMAANRDFSSPYLQERTGNKVLYLVIAGDRGLAGGYNSNVLNLVQSRIQGIAASVLPIGKKAAEYFRSRNIPTLTDGCAAAGEIGTGECFAVARMVCQAFLDGEFDEVYVAYTRFVSLISQEPTAVRLLPLTAAEDSAKQPSRGETVYEPDAESVFAAIVPEYLGGFLYGAICESRASEHAARRSAMDAASSNADELIAGLRLKFNQTRQAAITQEITEIVAGS